ncbi:MAG: hypothetical protein ACOCXJ_01980 [Planctomycetota bacterium]
MAAADASGQLRHRSDRIAAAEVEIAGIAIGQQTIDRIEQAQQAFGGVDEGSVVGLDGERAAAASSAATDSSLISCGAHWGSTTPSPHSRASAILPASSRGSGSRPNIGER